VDEGAGVGGTCPSSCPFQWAAWGGAAGADLAVVASVVADSADSVVVADSAAAASVGAGEAR
jgi:hypothetical protein